MQCLAKLSFCDSAPHLMDCVDYDFHIALCLRSFLKHVSPLLSVALSCNIELRTLPTENQSFTVELICHNKINILLLI